MTIPALIFTDMDGSLLNHHDYNFDAAKLLLEKLDTAGIPVIPNTSKTSAELKKLRLELNNSHPFITENGAAVYIPDGYFEHPPEGCYQQNGFWVKAFVKPRQHWLNLLRQLPQKYQPLYHSFSYLGAGGVAKATGLDNLSASLASQREFGEPISWLGTETDKQEALAMLKAAGANILEGGRFIHVSGNCDKGVAMQWLAAQYASNKHLPHTVAVGDSGNDIAMLNTADYAVLVKSPVKTFPILSKTTNIIKTTATAPEGWVEGVEATLAQINS